MTTSRDVSEYDVQIELSPCINCGTLLVAHEWDNFDWGEDWDKVDPRNLIVYCSGCQTAGPGKEVIRDQE